MGIILSRVRKTKSPVETLEKLEHEIKEIEESRTYAQMQYRKITKLFLAYSLGFYVLLGLILYFYFQSAFKGKLLNLVPIALSPLFLYGIKRIIAWYYARLINKNQIKLTEMKKEKRRILDEVMDKETYKVAKGILEKYSNESQPKPGLIMQVAHGKQHDEGLRKRITPVPNIPNTQPPSTIVRSFGPSPPPRSISHTPVPNRALQVSPTILPPAPILPLQRSYVDKVVEYLIGDGPNNRYALICSRCHSHNGMALREEFEYLSFKCCYCFFFNPARKIRPEAPKLEGPLKPNNEFDSDSDSKTSGESSDGETKAIGESELGVGLSAVATSITGDETSSCSNNDKDEGTEKKEISSDKVAEEEVLEDTSKPESSEEKDSSQPESDANCDESLLKS